jgi:hypothetical protein
MIFHSIHFFSDTPELFPSVLLVKNPNRPTGHTFFYFLSASVEPRLLLPSAFSECTAVRVLLSNSFYGRKRHFYHSFTDDRLPEFPSDGREVALLVFATQRK